MNSISSQLARSAGNEKESQLYWDHLQNKLDVAAAARKA
jgi:hypothetical protein